MARHNYNNLFADKISYVCCNHYKQFVKKTGKPQNDREWTVLAAVVAELCVDPVPGIVVEGKQSHSTASQ